MIMPDRRRPARPCGAVSCDQRDRIDLKAVPRIGGNISAVPDRLDLTSLAEQQPATLSLRACRGGPSNFIKQRS